MRPSEIMAAYETHKAAAGDAFKLLRGWCLKPLPRVPGCDTPIRLAIRIHCGKTIEQAAAAEYVYRWYLAILPGDQVTGQSSCVNEFGQKADAVSIFGAPHCFGM